MINIKILQIVTLIDPQMSFGGPVRVATNQTRALRSRGHEVDLIAACRGFHKSIPTSFDGEPVLLFKTTTLNRALGFSGFLSIHMLRWLIKNINTYDVVHIHIARDLITLPAAVVANLYRIPYVLQTHGMIDKSDRFLAVFLDKFFTKRLLRQASAVMALTSDEVDKLTEVVSGLSNTRQLVNGVSRRVHVAENDYQNSTPDGVEVLYLARLQERKRPQFFVLAAQTLAAKYPTARFRLVGPDEGEAPATVKLIASTPHVDVRWEGPIQPEQAQKRIAASSIYVLPSVNEPFPMSVLEAMALGIPVVVTDSCGLAGYLIQEKAGIVCGSSLESLCSGIETLLASEDLRNHMGANASALVSTYFSMEAVVAELEDSYLAAVRDSGSGVQ